MDIIVFTDGSFIKKRDTAGYAGYSVYFPNSEFEDISDPFLLKPYTNQRAELYAIYIAIKTITDAIPNFNNITIYTDSEYSLKCATQWIFKWVENDWKKADKKPVKNKDILKKLYNLLKKYQSRLYFVHVRSHTGKKDDLSIGNDKADKLANIGAERAKKIIEHIKKLCKKK